jgi:hypothetical protein
MKRWLVVDHRWSCPSGTAPEKLSPTNQPLGSSISENDAEQEQTKTHQLIDSSDPDIDYVS